MHAHKDSTLSLLRQAHLQTLQTLCSLQLDTGSLPGIPQKAHALPAESNLKVGLGPVVPKQIIRVDLPAGCFHPGGGQPVHVQFVGNELEHPCNLQESVAAVGFDSWGQCLNMCSSDALGF